MGHHFIIDKFIFFGEDDLPVQGYKFSKLSRLKYIDPLILTFTGKQLTVHTDRKLYIFRMKLRIPKFHFLPPDVLPQREQFILKPSAVRSSGLLFPAWNILFPLHKECTPRSPG